MKPGDGPERAGFAFREGAPQGRRVRRWKAARLLIATGVAALVLLAGVLLFAGFLGTPVAERLIALALPWRDGQVEIASIDFRGLRGLTVAGVRIAPSADVDVLYLDSLEADYRLGELLRERRRIRRLRLVGLRIDAPASESGRFWPASFTGSGTDGAGPPTRRSLVVDRVEVAGASLQRLDEEGRQVLEADVHEAGGSIAIGESSALVIEGADVRVHGPGRSEGRLAVEGRAAFAKGVWRIGSLEVTDAEGGRLAVSGTFGPRGTDGLGLDLRVEGNDFRIAQLFPSWSAVLSDAQRADVEARVRGTSKRPEISARVHLENAGGLRAESQLDLASGSPVLGIEVDFDTVDVERLTNGRVALGPVVGRIEARLDVSHADSLDGPLRLNLWSPGDHTMRIMGRTELTKGLAEVEIDARVRELDVQLRGHIRPFGPARRWDLKASGRTELPLPAFVSARESSWRGPWDVTVHSVRGGVGPDERVTTLDVRIEPVEPTTRAGLGTLSGRVSAGTLAFETKLALGGGTIEGVGELHLARPRSYWKLTRLYARDFALAPWVGQEDPGRLNAELRAQAGASGVTAAVRIDSVQAGRLAGIAGSIDIDLASGHTRLAGRLTRGGASVRIERLELDGSALQRASLGFVGVNPADLSGSLPRGNLTGHLTLEPVLVAAVATDLPAWARNTNVEGRLELSESWLGTETIAGGADLRFVAGELSFAVDLEGEGQSLMLVGTAKPAGRPFILRLDEGRLRDIDLSSWLGGRVPNGRISGTLRGDLNGTDPAVAKADVAVSLLSTRLGPLAVDRGNATLKLRDGRASLRGDGFGGGRRLALEIDSELRPGGSWRGGGTAQLLDPWFAAPDDTFDLRFSFATPDTLAGTGWHADLKGSGPLIAVRLDSLSAELDLDEDVLTLRRFEVLGPELRLNGEGDLPLSSARGREADLTVEGSTTDLGAVAAVVGRRGYRGRARLALHSSGRGSGLRHMLRIGVGDFRSRYLELDSLDVTLTARSDSVAWLAGVGVEAVTVGNRALLSSPRSLPLWVGVGSAGGSGQKERSRVELALDWNAAQKSVLSLSRFAARLGDEEWRLREPAAVSWDGVIAVDELVVSADAGDRVEARGRIDRHGEQELSVEITGLPALIGGRDANPALARRLDLQVRLSGRAETPRLEALGRLHAPEEATGPITITAGWTANRLRIVGEGQQREGGRFSLRGELPIGFSLAEGDRVAGAELVAADDALAENAVDLRVEVVDLDLAGLEFLLDQRDFRDLRGILSADVQVIGTAKAPQFDGGISVANFGLRLEEYGTEWVADRLALQLAGARATVVNGEIRSGQQGTLRLTGGVELSELTIGNVDLDVNLDRFLAADSRTLEAVLSGGLAVRGRLGRPKVQGRIQLDRATYWLSNQALGSGVERVELTESDYRELERRFGIRRDGEDAIVRGAAWDAADVDVAVSAQSNVWARRSFDPALAAELAGDVRIIKEPGGETRLEGDIRAVEGRSFVEEFGRRFAIASGSLRFDGPPSSFELESEATYSPEDDVTIRLLARGNAQGFSLTLGSDPEMDRADIISYIAVGRPRADVQVGQIGTDAAGLGADIAFSRLSGEVEELARQSLGLDVVEIQQDGLKGLTLVAGRYTSRRLFLGFQQPVVFQGREDKGFGIEDTEVDAEYRVNEWLLANLSGSRSLARFFLGVRHAY